MPLDPILELLQNPVRDFVTRYIVNEVDMEKMIQYGNLRQTFLYWQGKQFLVPKVNGGNVVDWEALAPFGTIRRDTLNAETDSRGRYDTIVNFVRGDGDKFIAVLGSRAPNPTAAPLIDNSIDCEQRARLVERICAALRKMWNVDDIHKKMLLNAWRDGTFFLYTPLEVEGNGALAPGIQNASGYTVTIPFELEDFNKGPWLWYEYELNKGEVIERFPIMLDDLETSNSGDNAVSQSGYWTRSIQSSQTGMMRRISNNRWTVSHFWLQPCMYNFFGKQELNLPEMGKANTRDYFKSQYPKGCKITKVGSKVVEIKAESYLDVWSCGQPGVSTTVVMPPVAQSFLPIQDVINNMTNLNQESIERGVPVTIADPDVVNIEAINSRPGVPGELIGAEAGSSGKLRDAMYNLPIAEYEPNVEKFGISCLDMGRQVTGVLPPIFGGGDANTAREADIKKTQALMQLGLVWMGVRTCWKGAYTNAVTQLATNGADILREYGLNELDIQAAPGLINPDTGKLFGVAINIDEAIPASWGQAKDSVMFVLGAGPEVHGLTGANDPANAGKIQDAIGVPGWRTPSADARDYVLSQIRLLLSEKPIEEPPDFNQAYDPMNPGINMEPKLVPSRPPDPVLIDPPEAYAHARAWLRGPDGMAQQQLNPEGWGNVKLWAVAWMELLGPGPGGAEGPSSGPPPGPNQSEQSPAMDEELPSFSRENALQ